jgi:oxaloacetate decarboxylase alpha subunit
VDLNDIKELLRILQQQEISEFELEHEGVKLRIRKEPSGVPVAHAAPQPIAPGGAIGDPASFGEGRGVARTEAPQEEGLILIKSPMVGTFYRTPSPESPPFVHVGDRIRPGQVLCIIEAMKLMNEIEAEQAGEIVSIVVESGQAVQYGDPLFTIRAA